MIIFTLYEAIYNKKNLIEFKNKSDYKIIITVFKLSKDSFAKLSIKYFLIDKKDNQIPFGQSNSPNSFSPSIDTNRFDNKPIQKLQTVQTSSSAKATLPYICSSSSPPCSLSYPYSMHIDP